jgi:hypothetical protein
VSIFASISRLLLAGAIIVFALAVVLHARAILRVGEDLGSLTRLMGGKMWRRLFRKLEEIEEPQDLGD